MIKSIQYLLSEIGDSIDARIKLKVLEPEAGSQEPLEFYEFKRRDDWPGEEVRDLLGRLATMIFTDSPGPEVTLEDGDGESALILKVSDSTPEILIDGFPGDRWALGCQTALDTLFNAIAKNKGWEVFVQIKPDLEYEAQPETSDGRFAKERP